MKYGNTAKVINKDGQKEDMYKNEIQIQSCKIDYENVHHSMNDYNNTCYKYS